MCDHLNDTALRSVAALDPLNLILDNLSQDHEEDCPPPPAESRSWQTHHAAVA